MWAYGITPGIIGAQNRDEYDKDDVEQYFNYMGLLAVEGSYDNMYKMLECAPPLSHTHTHTHTRTLRAVHLRRSTWARMQRRRPLVLSV